MDKRNAIVTRGLRLIAACWRTDPCGDPLLTAQLSNDAEVYRSLSSLIEQRPETKVIDYQTHATPEIMASGQILRVGGLHWTIKMLTEGKLPAQPDALHRKMIEQLDVDEPRDSLRRAMAARERLFGPGYHYAQPGPSTEARLRITAGAAPMVDPAKVDPRTYAIHQLRSQLMGIDCPRHVEGCACEICTSTRDGMTFQPIVERELSCPVCRRVYGRVRVEACATVEALCKGCEMEGRHADDTK